MIDISDGLAVDLHHLGDASGVGIVLHDVPVAEGASPDDALAGGDDYELLFTAPDPDAVEAAFAETGLRRPLRIGNTAEKTVGRRLGQDPLPDVGWEHEWE